MTLFVDLIGKFGRAKTNEKMAMGSPAMKGKDWYDVQQRQFSENLDRYAYEETPHFRRIMLKFMKFADIPANAHLLEIGCGTGRYTMNFLRAGYKVTGIDLSEESIRVLVGKAKEENLLSQLSVSASKIEDYMPEERFDFIMCIHVLHHVDDIYSAMQRAFVLLNPGGRFTAIEPNPYNPSWYIKRRKDWEAEKGLVRCTESNFRKYFSEAGYQNPRVMTYGAVPSSVYNRLPVLDGIEDFFAAVPLFNKVLALHFISGERGT